jgi:small subunit ribosomal protein S21
MTVYVKDNNVAAALRTLKKKLVKDHRTAELKRHEEYEKPSEARRRKQRQSEKRRANAAKQAAQQTAQARAHTTR